MAAKSKKPAGLKLLPAHTARAQVLQRRENAAIETELTARAAETFIKQLGGRTHCGELLAIAAESAEGRDASALDTLAALLLDPGYDRMSLADLCEQAGLTLRDLFRAHRGATLARAQIVSYEKIAAKLPDVVEDVMRRAAPYETACEVCQGTGSSPGPSPDAPSVLCETCRGRGHFMVDPELDRQKLALELGDLVKKGGGMSVVQQNLNVNGAGGANGGGAGSYERYQQALMSALNAPLPPPPAAQPAEVLDVTPEAGGDA